MSKDQGEKLEALSSFVETILEANLTDSYEVAQVLLGTMARFSFEHRKESATIESLMEVTVPIYQYYLEKCFEIDAKRATKQ